MCAMGACVVNQPFIGEGAHSRIDLNLIYWGVGTHRPQFIALHISHLSLSSHRPQFNLLGGGDT